MINFWILLANAISQTKLLSHLLAFLFFFIIGALMNSYFFCISLLFGKGKRGRFLGHLHKVTGYKS